jgi:uncharacterized membrane-anchored protein YhcB (DUF1043 family)
MELELVGPRVSVDRNGTADRGGGQLVVKQGKLLVRTRNLERLLGASVAIDHIQLVDLARMRAQVRFVDGQVWNVESEQGEDLTPFFKQVESTAGRAGLLHDPPRISELLRDAATPARVRNVLLTALALLAFVPLRWLGGLAPAVGGALPVFGVILLLLGVLARGLREDDDFTPSMLARLRTWVSWPWFAAALALIVAGVIGYSDATERLARERKEAQAHAEAAQQAAAAAAQQQQEARERRARTDALAQQLLDAMQSEHFREAKAVYDQLTALTPDHATAKQVRSALETALAELDERERVTGVARGIAQARAVARDPLACETAKRVADAYALLRRAQPDDADYAAARRVLGDLERCRKQVRARFAQSAEEGRRRLRMLAATQIETAVRRLGYPAHVTLAGKTSDVLRIEAHDLDATAAQRILALREKDAPFEAARTEDGFKRIELRGEKFDQDVKLHALPASAVVEPVLEKFGLAQPLALSTQ